MQQGTRKAEECGGLDRNLFRPFVEGVKDYAILMLDPQGHITSWNKGAEQIKGYTTTEIIGKHFSCLYPKADIESAKPERELEAALRDGRLEDEGWRMRKDGSVFWANVVITPILDQQGTLLGFCNIARDLTERRRRDLEEILRLTVSTLRSVTQSDAAVFLLFERVGKAISGYVIDFPESKGLLVARVFSATEESDSLTAGILRVGNPVFFPLARRRGLIHLSARRFLVKVLNRVAHCLFTAAMTFKDLFASSRSERPHILIERLCC